MGGGGRLKGDWNITVEILRRLCKKGIRRPRGTANEAAEWEIGRERRESKMLCSIRKYRYRISLMEHNELFKCYYKWQAGNLKYKSWAINLEINCTKLG
jgi:hypothetical protein